jgi:hypothetical protein
MDVSTQGCAFVCESFIAYYRMCVNGQHTGKVILRLVEAVGKPLTSCMLQCVYKARVRVFHL